MGRERRRSVSAIAGTHTTHKDYKLAYHRAYYSHPHLITLVTLIATITIPLAPPLPLPFALLLFFAFLARARYPSG